MWSNARPSRPSSSGPAQAAAHREVAGRELLGRMDQPRGAPRQQEVEDQPHRGGQRRDPAGPQQRLLHDLGARLGLVALQVVGQEQAAGAERAQLVLAAAEQDAGVAEQRLAVRAERHAAAALADRAAGMAQVELRQAPRRSAASARTCASR
jgi:hypothetical protein